MFWFFFHVKRICNVKKCLYYHIIIAEINEKFFCSFKKVEKRKEFFLFTYNNCKKLYFMTFHVKRICNVKKCLYYHITIVEINE